MQNKFIADIGDFGKYGLLKALSRDLKLGVVWYFVLGSPGAADGPMFRYLDPALGNNEIQFRACDSELYDKLRNIVNQKDKRTVVGIERGQVLLEETEFFGRELTNENREEWITDALDKARDCKLVFLDPDNGLSEGQSIHHVLLSEVKDFFDQGHSLIIYHHFNFTTGHVGMYEWREKLSAELGKDVKIIMLWYHRGTARGYFIILQEEHKEILDAAVGEFLLSCWGEKEHFTLIPREQV